ncbi:EamA family transporter [Bowdeniella nasicola]|uniref:EamA family transporter n=2 Tax=Bowdeniella nasicola TaxID=208480 RepID=A0A1Q5Q394_9ACTO|nr:EamA family transporter [Bowdeniella nasicola]
MFSVQLSGAFSVGFIDRLGPVGAAWLRMLAGAIILLAISRPKIRGLTRRDRLAVIALGITTGSMTFFFFAAIQRIPLGTAVAVEFLGPLVVAAVRGRRGLTLAYPLIAMIGVILLTKPWAGQIDVVGILFALGSGVGWAIYILLTPLVGEKFSGISALSLTIPIAAICYAPLGIPVALPHLSWDIIAIAFGLALLMPVIPLAFEIVALRSMSAAAFGTLAAIEPAMGVLIGALILAQVPTAIQLVGITLVVAAGIASQRAEVT